MRLFSVLLIIGASLAQLLGETPTHTLKSYWLDGHDYIDLAQWAESKDFKLNWPKKAEEGLLYNRWAKINLKAGGRRIEINGVGIWLCHSILNRADNYYISRLDLRTCLLPILYPVKPAQPMRLRTIALDPGHGGKDPGTQDGIHQEKTHTLLLAKELKKRMSVAGLRVGLTRASDTFIDLDQRPAIARAQKADLFISLHYNSVSAGKNGIKGVEVYCLPPQGANATDENYRSAAHTAQPGNRFDERNIFLAYHVQKALVKGLNVEDRGIRRERYAVLRQASMPAVLIECGFMSDPQEARRVYSDTYRRQLAQAITDGVLAYKRWLER